MSVTLAVLQVDERQNGTNGDCRNSCPHCRRLLNNESWT